MLLFLLTTVTLPFYAGESASVLPVNLLCEYLTRPSGLDVRHPRFSWTLDAVDPNGYGQCQTAYRILVSSRSELLETTKGICGIPDGLIRIRCN